MAFSAPRAGSSSSVRRARQQQRAFRSERARMRAQTRADRRHGCAPAPTPPPRAAALLAVARRLQGRQARLSISGPRAGSARRRGSTCTSGTLTSSPRRAATLLGRGVRRRTQTPTDARARARVGAAPSTRRSTARPSRARTRAPATTTATPRRPRWRPHQERICCGCTDWACQPGPSPQHRHPPPALTLRARQPGSWPRARAARLVGAHMGQLLAHSSPRRRCSCPHPRTPARRRA